MRHRNQLFNVLCFPSFRRLSAEGSTNKVSTGNRKGKSTYFGAILKQSVFLTVRNCVEIYQL